MKWSSRLSRSLVCGALLCSGWMAQAQPAVAPAAAAEGEDHARPTLRFSAVQNFIDAIGIEEEAARIVDMFWQPAIEALVASNPDRAAQARAFAAEQRRAELSLYPPLVALMIDNRAVELLNPDVARQQTALEEEMNREYARGGRLPPAREQAFALRAMQLRSEPSARANAELEAVARQARTPDGIALRALNRSGLFWCVGPAAAARSAEARPECARIAQSPVLRRLRTDRFGEKLILMSASANGQLVAMVQMGHDPGISLHLLLPPERVRAAGLNVPPDISLDELTASSRSTGRPQG
jgi:hypothetical protein